MAGKLSFTHVALTVGLVLMATFVGSSFKQRFAEKEQNDEYHMIKEYLLNPNVLYGNNRPKIWIHSNYEVNARKWASFMSRNSTDLNQPYLYLTVQSIIQHNGDDFHICLIDDESFAKLIPTWTIDLSTVPEPMRSRYRENAMLQLLYIYGGMIIPNSFLCLQSLHGLYLQGIAHKTPFMAERIARIPNAPQSKPFLPDVYFMGAAKEDPMLEKLIGLYQSLEEKQHFQSETEFNYTVGQWCKDEAEAGTIQIVDGTLIGVKTSIGKPVLLEDLMSEDYLDIELSVLQGVYIPSKELLRRPKYQYFSILPVEEVLKTNSVLTKYFQIAMVDTNIYNKGGIRKPSSNLVAI